MPFLSSIGINWLDVIIIAVLLFYAFEGFEIGFIASALDLLSFIGSFILGLTFYNVVGLFLAQQFSFPVGFANAGGFFIVALISELVLGFLFRTIVGGYYDRFVAGTEDNIRSHFVNVSSVFVISTNKILGILPGILSAFIILSFLLTVIVALPFSPFLKNSISTSRFGNKMIISTQNFEGTLHAVFGQAVSDTLNFLTVKPQSDDFVTLGFKTTAVTPHPKAEEEMLALVNEERSKAGLKPVVFDAKLREVARAHSKDMFARGYFSHNTPEGANPFDRMANFGIQYSAAGENLALAPNTEIAMQGLMKSEGHRKNILSSSFGKVGIGAIDGGIYGIMFSQEFTD